MPASMTTFLVLWSALLLPGAKPDPSMAAHVVPAPRQASTAPRFLGATTTIQSSPIDPATNWIITEAETGEEGSGEDGEHSFALANEWLELRAGRLGRLIVARLDRTIIPSRFRSPILRC